MINSAKIIISKLWLVKARLGVYLGSFLIMQILFSLLLLAKNATAAETFAQSFVVTFLASTGLIIYGFIAKNENISFIFSLLLLLGLMLISINEPISGDASFLEKNKNTIHIIAAALFAILLCIILRFLSYSVFEKPILICTVLCGINVVIYSLLFLFGNDVYGVKVSVMGINLCEIAKVVYILTLAYLFSETQISSKTRLIVSLVVLFINCAALFMLSELGTACILVVCYIFAQFLYGENKHTLVVFISFLIIIALSFFMVVFIHNQSIGSTSLPRIVGDNVDKIYYRIFSSKSSYQMEKALLATLNGGLLGSTEYNITVPIVESDFVVVALIQRFGLLSFIAYIIGLVCIVVMCCRAAIVKVEKNKDASLMFVFAMIGLFSIMSQSICSILMGIDFFPIIGICNPLIDAHGSNLMATSGIILCVLQGLSNNSGRSGKGENRERIHRIED